MSVLKAVAEIDLDALRVQVEGLDLDLEETLLDFEDFFVAYEVTVDGKRCAAKKLPSALIQFSERYPRTNDNIIRRFRLECCVLSQLKHPNVVKFVGVHYHDFNKKDISLIMECLHCDLNDFVWRNQDTPLCDRLHILYDVSKGLDYLHSLSPPLIQRDISAPKILLTEDLIAKIGGFGVSEYADPGQRKMLIAFSGNIYYMPPECQLDNPIYTTKLDIFSFGVLILHTVIGKTPDMYEIFQGNANLPRYVREGKVELMRRDEAVHQQMGETHCLYPLVVHCLHDHPDQRPTAGEVRESIKKLCIKHPRLVSYFTRNKQACS